MLHFSFFKFLRILPECRIDGKAINLFDWLIGNWRFYWYSNSSNFAYCKIVFCREYAGDKLKKKNWFDSDGLGFSNSDFALPKVLDMMIDERI